MTKLFCCKYWEALTSSWTNEHLETVYSQLISRLINTSIYSTSHVFLPELLHKNASYTVHVSQMVSLYLRLRLVHTYHASISISTTKSSCEPGRRKHKNKHISTFVLASSWVTRTFSCTYAYVVRVNQPLPRKDINIQLFFCRSHFLFRDFRPIF